MNTFQKHFVFLILSLSSLFPAEAAAQSSRPARLLSRERIEGALSELPDGERWVKHLREDLMPFWETAAALGGSEMGNFPSYRDNCGKAVDGSLPPEKQPPEIRSGISLGLVDLEREYLRTRSRQIFGYCIAFQMTGEEKYLRYAYAGLEYNYLQKDRFYDENDGTLAAYYDKRTGKYVPGTSQDWAYGLSGPAYYYCVTKDERVLPLLLKSHEKLEELFFDPGFGMYRWVTKNTNEDRIDQRELVANLDQIYGYMLFLYRSLPQENRERWKKRLHELAVILLKEFLDSRDGFFWGRAEKITDRFPGTEHTDFGHSTKTFWLIMQIGRLTGDPALEKIGREGAARLIEAAYDPLEQTWNRKMIPGEERGRICVRDREWWTLAVMDQAAGTLSLNDPEHLRYISRTHRFWFDRMVDRENKETWHLLKADDGEPDRGFPKCHAWKTCFHSTEHALVMYLVSQRLHGKKASLHFVRPREVHENPDEYHPYVFEGEVRPESVEVRSDALILPRCGRARVHVEVSFGHIR